ncbi:DUF552 domain-containing protein [Gordonia amarae]|uniref:Cell division protein SepF n=2 Tax=Gordonia amarae TaxID=36821 RepID=G7GPL4_9ACTN|nr:cell division protein SepF [Gordonia amarae]MCS3879557.1 cell division inhibitor SepF [Gordonia amarae]QHN18019.1 DUF552 domain-containing protein [Gordonia amarae]QHN22539.1 DUF552 domain-containing protein [Gordonia amarae]QHN31404.1 DUF552 domain-containing protein [Gordonia amarae]QHN40150.1 DUF552 domain-containing protein [Gordonia amarae]
MTTMQKFKAYFGMVPPSEYEDDYLEEPGAPLRAVRGYRDDYEADYRDTDYRDSDYLDSDYRGSDYRDADYRDPDYREPDYRSGGFADGPRDADYSCDEDRRYDDRAYEKPEYAYAGGRHIKETNERLRQPARLEPLQRSAASTLRSANARPGAGSDQHELDRIFADGPLHKITTLRPSDYSEARTIGERYRDGSPVIMDLVNMSNDDAKRLVDFAAGLAFALRGSFDKVATKVFLLSPADVDVTPEDRRKIAETGFYNH